MRVLVFEDSVYWHDGSRVYTDQSFLRFASQLSRHVDVTVLGRLAPERGASHYPLPDEVAFVGLTHYASLVDPRAPRALVQGLRAAWGALGDQDVAWLLGPHPLSVGLVCLARLRGVRSVLGVRQDLPAYARHRHPGRRWTHVAAVVLEACWRALARRRPVIVVGPELARTYRRASHLLEVRISLAQPAPRVAGQAGQSDAAVLTLLSVGRLESEKNPLLLVEVLQRLRAADDRWRLVVCGEGPLRPDLEAALRSADLAGQADVLGYVPLGGGLEERYRECDVFLHVSWTEGVPQVLFEAWGNEAPVVATDVGGVAAASGGAALLVPPGDAGAAAEAVLRVAADEVLRERLVAAGTAQVEAHSADRVLRELAAFLQGSTAAEREELTCAG